jgi:hypothetical protein
MCHICAKNETDRGRNGEANSDASKNSRISLGSRISAELIVQPQVLWLCCLGFRIYGGCCVNQTNGVSQRPKMTYFVEFGGRCHEW